MKCIDISILPNFLADPQIPLVSLMSTTAAVSTLYRSLLRQGRKFDDYNIRSYAERTIKTQFRESSREAVEKRMEFGQKQLDLLNRQSTLSAFYPSGDSVMDALKR